MLSANCQVLNAKYQMPVADLILETERLTLRPLTREDADAIFAVLGDAIAMQHYPRRFTRKDAEEWIERNLRRYAEHGHGLYAVVLKASGEVIGDCGLVTQQIEGRPELEVGYHLRRDQWGHGYATEAARACLEMIRRQLDCPYFSGGLRTGRPSGCPYRSRRCESHRLRRIRACRKRPKR